MSADEGRVFRKSRPADIDQVVRIAEAGKTLLRSRHVSQWQRGTYPDRANFLQDVQDGIGYVVASGDRILAVCAVTFTDEPSYRALLTGRWLTAGRYATIHRCAVAPDCRGQGVAGFLFGSVRRLAAAEGVDGVRVDTHPDNAAMRSALAKAGFVECGELRLADGAERGDLRLGYERLTADGGAPANVV